ncbi:MAG: DUF72 domain-containing protein [Actinobacteria bacterium]|nr:DUF72 domain-containing protein [Actinomycetota bacterium]MBV8478667.1 DUF72 domain-containing protein [Actinomycetota bacterium]
MPRDRERVVRVGCSGWNYDSWKEPFYAGRPPREWLELYAQRFDTVELNTTFYRLPNRTAVEAWERTAPEDFCFAVKVSRYITHVKRLTDVEAGLAHLLERLEPLCKRGPFLWQLPPNFRRDDDRLGATLAALPPGRHAFEFRHASWFADDVYDLLRAHGAALVLTGEREVFTAPWTYVRFHHGTRGRRGNYSESELSEWAERIRAWTVDVYAYFNNDWEAFAPRNALRLRELVYA